VELSPQRAKWKVGKNCLMPVQPAHPTPETRGTIRTVGDRTKTPGSPPSRRRRDRSCHQRSKKKLGQNPGKVHRGQMVSSMPAGEYTMFPAGTGNLELKIRKGLSKRRS